MVPAVPAAGSNAHATVPISLVEEWYDEHADCLLALAHRMLGDRGAAEAVVVAVFVEAHHVGMHWRRHDCERHLLELTQRHAGEACRRQREAGIPRRAAATPCWPLSALDPPQRDVVEAAFFEGFGMEELAARFGSPTPAVARCLRAGMDQLARLMAGDEVTSRR